jgi:hypothetical protein
MPVGAAIGSAVVGAGATVYASNKAAKASKNALNAQQGQLDKVWGSVNPFLQSGNDALAKLNNPNASFMASPDYAYRKSQALDGVTTNKAVNGLLRSGSALGAVTQKASDLASGEFGNWWNRQSGLATMGLDANRIGAGLAGTAVNAIGTNGANQGNAALATGNAIGGFAGSIGDLINQYGGGNSQGSSYSPESQTTMPIPEEMKGLY